MRDYLESFAEIVSLYDAYLFDIYGVLHNGKTAYIETRDCLMHLAALEKRTLLLSNAPQRNQSVITKLEKYGIPPSLYQYILTAGELTRQALLTRSDPWHARLGDCCYVIGTALDEEILAGTDIHKVHTLEESDFILTLGIDEWNHTFEDYQEILDEGLARDLPMVCANPDLNVFSGETQELRAGRLAQYYQVQGGRVYYHGKPYAKAYQQALRMAADIPLERVLALGDSLQTDCKGAQNFGIDFVLCFNRLTAHELGIDWETSKLLSYEKIMRKITQAGYNPQYIIFEKLIW